MTSPWELVDSTDNGPAFKRWLINRLVTEQQFNAYSFDDINQRRTQFEQQLQQQQQQQQQQQRDASFYQVTGAISRPSNHSGARFNLFRFASADGLYPRGLEADTAFQVLSLQNEATKNILKFSIVFQSLNAAAKFLDDVGGYLQKSRGMLYFCDNNGNVVGIPPMTPIGSYQVNPQDKILLYHYGPRQEEDEALDSPVIDVVMETRSKSDDITVDVTVLSRRDEVFRYQRIENSKAFALAEPEGAHIFPRSKCVGPYEWLNDKPFNRIALSRDFHLNFDGSGRGRGKRRKTVQTFAMRPIRNDHGYSLVMIDSVECFEIPLEIVINDNTKAESLLEHLQNHAELNKNGENGRWTITGAEVRLFYPQNRQISLISELPDPDAPPNTQPELVTAVPGVVDLNTCWSNSSEDLLCLEAAEIMEKCLCWNYQEALRNWSMLG